MPVARLGTAWNALDGWAGALGFTYADAVPDCRRRKRSECERPRLRVGPVIGAHVVDGILRPSQAR